MEENIKILILEDNESDVRLILNMLIKEKVQFTHLHVDNEDEYRKGIEEYKPNIILSDYMMPVYDGMSALLLAKKLTPHTPVIIVTGSMNEETAVECIKAGAADYVIKEHLAKLALSIKNSIKSYKMEIERMKAQEVLKEKEKLLRDTLAKLNFHIENTPLGVVEFDNKFKVVKWSKMAETIFGWTEAEIIGKAFDEIHWVHEQDVERVKNIRKVMARGENTRNVNINKNYRKDGSVITCEWYNSVLLGEDGKLVSFQSLVSDITQRKEAEERLRESENRMRLIVEGTPYLFFYTQDTNAKITYISPSIEKITGHSVESWLAQSNWFITDNKINEVAKERTHAHLKGEFTEGSILLEIEHADKHPVLLEVFENPLIVNGEVIGIQGVAHDITESKRAEEELIKAKEKAESANKLKDAFIANISHEIRTPLSGILGMISLIKETYQNNIKKEDEMLFEGIDISSNRIIRTVDMILNYSRLHVGEFNIAPNKINISRICTNLIKEFDAAAKNKSLELSFQNNCDDTEVLADEYSITMAISNLIDNAIKYTNKGSVSIILYKGKNDDLILNIKDTGIGIDKEYLDHLFEPYRQEEMGYGRTYEGIGLGLAIVKKIIDLNKYAINIESKKGDGTIFSINFGKGEQLHENKSKTEKADTIPSGRKEPLKKVVLLVEDDLMNQITIRRFIEKKFNVITTASSDEATEIITKGKVDIILMDISIKGSKNGLELTKELKASKEFSHIPIIAVTAHVFEEDKQNSLAAGCEGYLAKPFTKESLLKIIDSLEDKNS